MTVNLSYVLEGERFHCKHPISCRVACHSFGSSATRIICLNCGQYAVATEAP